MINLGQIKIDGAVLAPMAGFTSSAYRQICRNLGAGMVVSEMVSAKAMCFGDKKTAALIDFKECERPYAIQIFASDVDSAVRASQMLLEYKPDLIDINMGCPVPKIVGSGSGSALLQNHKLAGEIVSAMTKALPIPVSVKMRIGWDSDNICAVDFARRLEDCGAQLITVHGRTRQQMYLPSVNLDAIAAVKAAVKVPVIANGDVASYADAQKTLKHTNCDGIMVGRAALGNPYIFSEIRDGDKFVAPTFEERMDTLLKLCDLEIENKGEHLACLELRRHLPLFFKSLRGASELRRLSCTVCSRDDINFVIKKAYEAKKLDEGE